MKVKVLLLMLALSLVLIFSVACAKEEDNRMVEEARVTIINDQPVDIEDDMTGLEDLSDSQDKLLDLDGVWIETEYETYPIGVQTLKAKWYNSLKDEMMYGNYFVLEQKLDNEWEKVRKESDIKYAFTDIGWILESKQARWHTYNMEPYTEGLSDGEYRISTDVSQMTLDGLDYGAGKYPSYQIYGYFKVASEALMRDMTNFDESTFEYRNSDYGFAVDLPEDWRGYSEFKEAQDNESASYDLLKGLDENYERLVIRHPSWSVESPYQDIVLAVLDRDQWNTNAEEVTKGDFDLLHEAIVSNNSYLVVKDESDYNSDLPGYDEVLRLLENAFKSY